MNLEELYECTIESLAARTFSNYYYGWGIPIISGRVSIDMTRTSYRLKREILNKTKEYRVKTQETYVFPKRFCRDV